MSLAETLAKAVVDEEASLKDGERKEKARLAREPFKTLFEPYSPLTIDQLKGWRPPPGDDAYILLEKKYIERGTQHTDTIRFTLFTMIVGRRPDQIDKLRYYVQVKGMRIIHYDRFPKINDSIAPRAELALQHLDKKVGKTAYEKLEIAIHGFNTTAPSGVANALAAKDSEIKDLKAKLAEKREKEINKEKEKEPQK